MEILIDDIPEEGLIIDATYADKWLGGLVNEVWGGSFEEGDEAKINIELHKVNRNVTIDGVFNVSFHPDCDRCLAHFRQVQSLPFHMVIAPLYESRRQRESEEDEGIEIVKEDLEFAFYEGDRFDLAEIIREQILLSQPMKHLCRENCKGLCQSCGKDLNKSSCACEKKPADARWEPLKKLKLHKR